VGADAPETIQPGIFFGKGFGDLPVSPSWPGPFAITGAVVDEIPLGTVGRALAPNLAAGGFDSVLSPAVFCSLDPNAVVTISVHVAHLGC
jgi:hypothetical protein